jgi:hypothetical protein
MGLRKILILEKWMDVELKETKKIKVHTSPAMRQRLKTIKKRIKALLMCF